MKNDPNGQSAGYLHFTVLVPLALFLFFLPWSLKWSNLFLLAAGGIFFGQYLFLYKEYGPFDRKRWGGLFSSVFVFYLLVPLSLLYTAYPGEAVKFLEYRAAMLFIPLMFFSGFRMNRRETEWVLAGLVAGVLLRVMWFYGLMAYGLASGRLGGNLTFSPVNALDPWLHSHRTYLSFYFLLALTAVVTSRHVRYPFWFKAVCGVLMLTAVFLFESRVLIGLGILLPLVWPFLAERGGRVWRRAAVCWGIMIVSLGLSAAGGSFRVMEARFDETAYELASDGVAGGDGKYDYDSRASRWKAAVELIARRPLAGYGSGGEKEALRTVYEREHLDWSAHHSLDVHNQFLSFALENGVLAALFYLYMLLLLFFGGWRRRDWLIVIFAFICGTMSLFENILNVNWMITLFSFLSTLFVFRIVTRQDD